MSIRVGETIVSSASKLDNSTINKNVFNEMQAIGIVDTNDSAAIKTWTGTLAEYNALETKDEDTLYNITDDFIVGGTPNGRNIGDIFYSARTDDTLSGAVRCNGATYNMNDFIGSESINNLLINGKLPYISMANYTAELALHGSCGKFGWDGGTNVEIRVPTLNDVFLEASSTNTGTFIAAGLPNITGSVINDTNRGLLNTNNSEVVSGAFKIGTAKSNKVSNSSSTGYALEFDASQSNNIYGNSTTVQPNSIKYSAFIQLTIGATDEAVEICTGVTAEVAAHTSSINYLNTHRIIAYQNPTADNEYTWYRKYADGWVEQGGSYNATFGPAVSKLISYPIVMKDTNYTLTIGAGCPNVVGMHGKDYISDKTVSGFTYTNSSIAGSFTNNNFSWQVSGLYE